MKENLLIISLILVSITAFTQKRVTLETRQEVVEAAKKEFNQAMRAPQGELYLFKQENNITGEYTIDITIHEKGKVATVFVVSNKGGTIKQQNLVKDFVKEFRLSFKMPKGKDYKFQYIFKFK